MTEKIGNHDIIFNNMCPYFMCVLTACNYNIDFTNNTGEKAVIRYGNVHDEWSPDNSNMVSKQGHIMVRYIYSLSLYIHIIYISE